MQGQSADLSLDAILRFFSPEILVPFLVGFVTALLVFALIGRTPLRLAPIFRAVGAPFRRIGRWARRFRIFRARTRASHTASESATAVERGIDVDSEVDAALREVDESPDNGETKSVHDFREEEDLLVRSNTIFRNITIPADYLPAHLSGQLTDEIAELYAYHAKRFFAVQVNLSANPKSLYEDAEGAFIISLFRSVDRRAYYVLNEIRKTINGNARRLTIVLGLLVHTWFVSTLWFAVLPFTATPDPSSIVPTAAALVLSATVTVALMFLVQNSGYSQQQRHSSRELRFFLNRYLGRVADRYREATGNAKQVTVGDERDPKKLSERAQLWHKIMIWIPFRTFFIECYVRNIVYQINRNCSYYLYLPWLGIGLLVPTLYVVLYLYKGVTIGTMAGAPDSIPPMSIMLALVTVIVCFFYHNRVNAVVLGEELSRLDWLGYQVLNVSSAMDEVVGKYAEDVGFWKGRMKF